ncbi:MAG: glutaminase A [Planctomycetes bacterium]|nr:glutaminase A [Planctomycetota bacterium]MCB9903978.1 glutaminase A [Planctomycetota bacterium]
MNQPLLATASLTLAAAFALGFAAQRPDSGGVQAGLGYVSSAQDAPDVDGVDVVLDSAHSRFAGVKDGANADYIPVLAEVDSELFAIALVTVDGEVHVVGDGEARFSIQSISKVFSMAQVLSQLGPDALLEGIGVDATGRPFNSIIAIEEFQGREMNPLVNAGAITTTGMIPGADADAIFASILANLSGYAGRELDVDLAVCASELASNQRNQAIGALMHAYGLIDDHYERAVEVYTRQCSVSVDTKDLAVMAGTLANGGKNPVTKRQVLDPELVPRVLAVMATAGLYDDSGKWLFSSGLPAKSGVGGGIIAVSPGRFGIAAFSPRLDAAGNSVRAQLAIRAVSDALDGNPYHVTPR